MISDVAEVKQTKGSRMSKDLQKFGEQLLSRLTDPFARPFVCKGSPYAYSAFIVGINAATRLEPFADYWSHSFGFDWDKFKRDYQALGKKEGNRRPIEAISRGLGGALETNVCSKPSRKPNELTVQDWKNSLLPFLFEELRPKVVFVHAKRPIQYMEEVTGCKDVNMTPQPAEWMGHKFWLCGRSGALYTLGTQDAFAYGARLRDLPRL